MKTWGIIPVRMDSSRCPGKPLKRIRNIPMVGHVYFRCKMSSSLDELYIATCDEEIRTYAEKIGAPCIMTSPAHERATDRTAEAMLKIEKATGQKPDVVVMIQGDEPMIVPQMINDAVLPLAKDTTIQVVNLMSDLTEEEFSDPNEVKVVVDKNGFALYFSREAIPSTKKTKKPVPRMKQVCIIPFRRDFLLEYLALPATPLEVIESVDMLRILEHGSKVKMVYTPFQTWSVDTQEDLDFVSEKMAGDELCAKYF